MMTKKKSSSNVIHWVTIRNENTGELLGNCRSFTDLKEANAYKAEAEEMPDPMGIQTTVDIETLNPEFETYPPKFKMKR